MKKLLLIAGFMIMGFNAYAGIDKGNGGDRLAQSYKNTLANIFLDLTKAYGHHINIDEKSINLYEIMKRVPEVEIQMVKGPLMYKGAPVQALNFPDKNLIKVDADKVKNLYPNSLLIHEMLGLMRIDDTKYQLSERIFLIHAKLTDFPYESVYQKLHQKWSESTIADMNEMTTFIEMNKFKCRWVSYATKTTQLIYNINVDPNQWVSRPDVIPQVVKENDAILGITLRFGLTNVFNGSELGNESELINGKIVTQFFGVGKITVSMGILDGVLFIKSELLDTQNFPANGTMTVCEPMAGIN